MRKTEVTHLRKDTQKQIMRKASKGSKDENPEKEGKTERRARLT